MLASFLVLSCTACAGHARHAETKGAAYMPFQIRDMCKLVLEKRSLQASRGPVLLVRLLHNSESMSRRMQSSANSPPESFGTLAASLLAFNPALALNPSPLALGNSVELQGLLSHVGQGVSQGAVGAVVGAGLSAFTEPMINRVLVERISVKESLKRFDVKANIRYFKTCLWTNFIKFPYFEALNSAMYTTSISVGLKGALTGIFFTIGTLPLTNYRFCKSMRMPIDRKALFKAFLPTLFRDTLYGICRSRARVNLATTFPELLTTPLGRAALLFPEILIATLLSSPGNELRGYMLQPKHSRMGWKAFFRPKSYAQSALVSGSILAISLSVGSLVTFWLKSILVLLSA